MTPTTATIDMRALPITRRSRLKIQAPGGQAGDAAPRAERQPARPGARPRRPRSGGPPGTTAEPQQPVFEAARPSFDGIGSTNRIPPDTVIDVGPDHIVEMVNSSFEIFDKAGTSLAGPSPINSLWTAAGLTNTCAQRNDGDPVVLYDHLADRWILTQFAVPNGFTTPPTFECVAVSRTGDPTAGTWFLYQFQFGNAMDYPKLGLWRDGYYMSSQRGFPSDATTPSLDVYALDRATMLTGGAVTPIQFTINGPSLIPLPSDLDGPAPAAGTPAFFARHVDGNQWGGADRIDVFSFTANFANPAASAFTQLPSLPTAAFDSNLCNTGNLNDPCVPQPGTTQQLATLPHWPMYSLQFRTLAGVERMVFNHTVDADGTGHAAPMWHELRRPAGGAWALFQEGVFAPDNGAPGLADDLHRWMGSIAMDSDANLALGYSASSTTVFPSVLAAGRRPTDPAGTLPSGEVTIVAGGGSQTPITCAGGNPCGHRWGDYSAMRVDPVDDCTFWYGQEYIATTSAGNINWRTRIGALRFSSCVPRISIDDVQAFEGNAGTTAFTFTVSLARPSAQQTRVQYTTADGTATVADGDYQARTGTLAFAPGETSTTVTVPVNGDVTVEPDETFFVNLSNLTNGVIADGQGVGTIRNDDLSAVAACTITGTNRDDVLAGTPGNDVICGGNGDDRIDGLGGHDVLRGDNGKDTLVAGDGNDLLLGGNAVDTLDGGDGNDTLRGLEGNDSFTGGAGSDALFGAQGADALDTRDGVPANDLADGGLGPDTCVIDVGDFRVSCP